MKKLILLMFMFCSFGVFAQEPPTNIPLVDVNGDTFFVNITEYVDVAKKTKDIYNVIVTEANDNPGKSVVEWLLFIVTVLVGGGGVTYLTQLFKVASNLVKIFTFKMGTRMFVAAFSFALSAVISYATSGNIFSEFTLALWGSIFMVSTGVYVLFLKKGNAS